MTSRSYKLSRGILFGNRSLWTSWAIKENNKNSCGFCFVLNKNKSSAMPIIAAVVAHRRYHPNKSDPFIMTKHCAKGTTPTIRAVNQCSAYNNNNMTTTNPSGYRNARNNNQHQFGSGSRPLLQSYQYGSQQQQVSFSTTAATTAKSLKSKLSGVLSLTLTRLVNCDHEESRRFYAKGSKAGKGKAVVRVNEEEMAELIDVDAYRSQLDKLTEQMRDDFAKQLSVRNAAGALEMLMVEFEGEKYPLQELAQVGRKNPQLAILNLSSLPDALQPVLKAINESGMNLNPQQDGTTIYVPLPKVTREHRENLSRNAKSLFIKYKTSYQTVQNRYVKQVRSNSEGVSQDLVYSVQQQIMKMASDYIAEGEKLLQSKQKELLQQEK